VLTKRNYADLLQATLDKCNSFTDLLSVTNPPPIPTLAKIAYALGVHVSYFFEDEGESNGGLSIIKKNERKRLIGDYKALGFEYEAIIRKKSDKNIRPLIVTLPHGLNPNEEPAKILSALFF
jgi:hypothetical protein